jgi:glycosyltransferase involved in cell wall biosynthesis
MTTDAVGGVWNWTADMAAHLAARGTRVLIACMGPRAAPHKRSQMNIPGIELREHQFALEWMADPWGDVDAAGQWLLELQSEFRADVIHLSGYSHAALAWNAPVIVTAHSCVCSWWRAVYGCAAGEEWNEYRRRVTEGLRRANAITAPSQFMAEALCKEYELPITNIDVIYNFSRVGAKPEMTKQRLILAAGRIWDKAKNLQMLEEIAGKLAWRLQVADSLPYDELQRAMSRASIFAHPALYEPFGLAVLEAAKNRCSLVLSDIASLRELWDGAAIFIDPGDPDRWIFELNRLSVSNEQRRGLASRAAARARCYRLARAVRQYLAVYRRTLEGYGRANGAAA